MWTDFQGMGNRCKTMLEAGGGILKRKKKTLRHLETSLFCEAKNMAVGVQPVSF